MPHISMLMRKNLLVNISKLVRDMRIFFAVPHLTRKTFAVYQQVAEYDCADDIEYRGAAMQPISTLTRIFPEYSSKSQSSYPISLHIHQWPTIVPCIAEFSEGRCGVLSMSTE